MSLDFLVRRVKRGILDTIAWAGYDVEKVPATIRRYRFLKRLRLGSDAFDDTKTILGGNVRCVFDVGAHVGQTAVRLAEQFREARIFSFEPDPDSYAKLQRLAEGCSRITAVNAAVGEADGAATFFVNRFDQTNSLMKTAPGAERHLVVQDGMVTEREIQVPVLTLDRFCAERQIDRIDLLKLDTQGYELQVLDGARGLLSRVAVPLIYLEVSFVRYYDGQPLFPEVYQYLYDRGYRMVWLYESGYQTHVYSVGANGLFVHESLGSREARLR